MKIKSLGLQLKKLSFIELLCYSSTFILIFLSYVYKDQRLILYSFEVFYICLIFLHAFRNKININKYFLWSLVFLIIVAISAIYSYDKPEALKQTFNVLKIILISNSIIFFINGDKKKLNFVLISFLVSGLYLSIILFINTPMNYFGTARIGESIGLNSNDLGLNMAITTIIALYLGKENKNILYYVSAFLFGYITLFSGSRKAALMIIIGIIILYMIAIKRKRFILVMIAVISTGIYLLWSIIMKVPGIYNVLGYRLELMINGFRGAGKIDNSTAVRLDMIEVGKSLFYEKPLFGHGIANYASLSGYSTYSHNNYIELLVGVGLIGTIIYYLIYIYIITNLLKNISGNNYSKLFLTLLIGLIIMEYGLVSYYVEIYQIIIATAFAATKVNRVKNKPLYINSM